MILGARYRETHVIIGNKNKRTEEEIVLYKTMIEDNKAPTLYLQKDIIQDHETNIEDEYLVIWLDS